VKKSPDEPSFHCHLGAALLKKGDKDKARVELQAALDREPRPADEKSIRDMLAGIH
jgi:Flp pilus assembly protein TadD